MTAGGINRIIAQLRADKRTSGIVVCPICEGGTRKRRTLSVDLRDGVWLYLCHRASCPTKGAVPAVGNDGRILMDGGGSVLTPRPLMDAMRFPAMGDDIADRLVPLIGDAVREFSNRHGLRVLVNNPDTHVWSIENALRMETGHVTRTKDKRVLTWRAINSPFYGVFTPPLPLIRNRAGTVVLVEDPLSASLLAEEGFRAVALLGTNLSREAAQEIVTGLGENTAYMVALDPDDAGRGASQKVLDRLRVAGARRAWQWLLPQDVNKMTIPERRALSNAIEDSVAREDEWQKNIRT